jgi:O-antigen/teichoic acid export membrane protein
VTETSGAAGRRLTTITIDQAVSSGSNILITVLAARVLGVASFGRFGIVFLVAVATQGVSRALVGEPLLIRPEESRHRPGEALGSAFVLGSGLGVVVAVGAAIAFGWQRDLGTALLVLALCTPLLCLQDLGRFLAFATHRPERALTLDLAWLGLQLAAVAWLVLAGAVTLTWFLVAWAGSGALAGTLLFWQHREHRMRPGLGWLRETWPFSWRYALSFAATQGSALGAAVALAGILGVAALGSIRGALLLFGPLVQLQAASIAAGTSEVSHLPEGSAEMRRHVTRSTVLTSTVAVVNLVVLVALPDRLGRVVLGATWDGTQRLLWPAGTQMVFLGLISGVRSGLLGRRAVRRTLVIDIVTTVITFTATIVGALVGGVVMAFWCLAGAQGVVAIVWWVAFWDHMRHGDRRYAVAPTPAGA